MMLTKLIAVIICNVCEPSHYAVRLNLIQCVCESYLNKTEKKNQFGEIITVSKQDSTLANEKTDIPTSPAPKHLSMDIGN